jgi:hemoglobin
MGSCQVDTESTEAATRGRARRARATLGAAFGFLGLVGAMTATAALPLACGSSQKHVVVASDVSADGGTDADAAPPPPPPLYTRLGGKDGVSAIVDSFADNLLTDPRLKKAFAKTKKGPKLDHFKQMLNDQICDITGGGCKYTGKTMSDGHAGMKITGPQFDAFVADFQLALEEKQVNKDDQKEFLDQLNLLKDQIASVK